MLPICRGIVLLNGAGRIEDVQTAVEAPVAAALSSSEKDALSAIDPQDFEQMARAASGTTASSSQSLTSQSASSQKPAPLTKSSKEQSSFISSVLAPLATIAKRVAVYGSFILTKQPGRVKQVLQQVSSYLLILPLKLAWPKCQPDVHQLTFGITQHTQFLIYSHVRELVNVLCICNTVSGEVVISLTISACTATCQRCTAVWRMLSNF